MSRSPTAMHGNIQTPTVGRLLPEDAAEKRHLQVAMLKTGRFSFLTITLLRFLSPGGLQHFRRFGTFLLIQFLPGKICCGYFFQSVVTKKICEF